MLSVGLDQVTLRANAYVELHAWLAAAGRGAAAPPPGLDASAAAYGRALADDDRDELLAATTAALSACTDDRCARSALASTPFARAFGGSLDTFVGRWWTDRATLARSAIEIGRAAFTIETEVVVNRISADLAIDWPQDRAAVAVVAEAPPAGRQALVPVALSARGTCFMKAENATERAQQARLIDCVLVHATRPLGARSALGVALERQLGAAEGRRAWELVAIHAVAATITAWEPTHLSPTRRSALAVEPKLLAWLAENWRARAAGEGVDAFAARFAAAFREASQRG